MIEITSLEGISPDMAAESNKKTKKRNDKAAAKSSSQGGKKDGKGKGKWEAYSGPEGSGNGYRLNVKNLSSETNSAETLRMLFEPFGTVLDAQVKAREDGSSRGFGFVILSNEHEASQAMEQLDNRAVGGKSLSVSPAQRRQPAEVEAAAKGGKGKGKTKTSKGGEEHSAHDPFVSAMMQQMFLQMQFQQIQAAMGMGGLGGGMGGLTPEQAALTSPYTAAAFSNPYANPFGSSVSAAALSAASEQPQQVYYGTLKSSSTKNGYGFIECPQTWMSYARDVYVDIHLLPAGVKPGMSVKFTINVNQKGHPKAASVEFA